MSAPRDPELIVADWLDDGPVRLPDQTRRAIVVGLRSTTQRRSVLGWSWMSDPMAHIVKLAGAAIAVVLVAAVSLSILVPAVGIGGPTPTPTPSPTSSPTPSSIPSSTASIPAMTQPFTSADLGYSIRYPAGWVATAGIPSGPPAIETGDTFAPPGDIGVLRAVSAVVPADVVVDDWIAVNLTNSESSDCMRPRDTLEPVTIDGHAGRLRGFCGDPPATEVEATVVVGDRVYMFTYFSYVGAPDGPSEADVRALFDALVATVQLDPQAAASPSPA